MTEYPMLARLYSAGSLTPTADGVRFEVKNRLFDATLLGIGRLTVDGVDVPLDAVTLLLDDGTSVAAADVDALAFPMGARMSVTIRDRRLTGGPHELSVAVRADPFGDLAFHVTDHLAEPMDRGVTIPRLADDWSHEAVDARREFVVEATGYRPTHLFDTTVTAEQTHGNIEHFIGAAQVPVGIAGPLRINGEHAHGDVLVPMATTEGTLVASYNRGMKALTLAGGVTTTVLDDRMQRAPVFVFDSAREARDFAAFVREHLDGPAGRRRRDHPPRRAGRASSPTWRRTLRSCASTSAPGTRPARTWWARPRSPPAPGSWNARRRPPLLPGGQPGHRQEGLPHQPAAHPGQAGRGRGVLPRAVLSQVLRVEPRAPSWPTTPWPRSGRSWPASTTTACTPPTASPHCSSPAARTWPTWPRAPPASSTPSRPTTATSTCPSPCPPSSSPPTGVAPDCPPSATASSCWAAPVTAPPCKLAEIVAAAVLAGELSLASAISSLDWVSSHEQYGRNR